MAEAVDAVDDFLADVTTFVVTHGVPQYGTALERQVGIVHVRAEPRNARLDARGFERLPAASPSADCFGRRNQFVRHGAEGRNGNKKVEADKSWGAGILPASPNAFVL